MEGGTPRQCSEQRSTQENIAVDVSVVLASEEPLRLHQHKTDKRHIVLVSPTGDSQLISLRITRNTGEVMIPTKGNNGRRLRKDYTPEGEMLLEEFQHQQCVPCVDLNSLVLIQNNACVHLSFLS